MDDQAVIRRFHQIYYDLNYHGGGWKDTRWMGANVYKCPLDLWIYHEIVFSLRPDVIVETGSADGGSGLYLASMCDLTHNGFVLSIDIEKKERPTHPRLLFMQGDTSKPESLDAVKKFILPDSKVMAILDSEHTKDHVLAELNLFAPLVTPGQYLIVEDTNINNNPVVPMWGPGPNEALGEWLPGHPDFQVDGEKHKFLLSFNPGGYLRRAE